MSGVSQQQYSENVFQLREGLGQAPPPNPSGLKGAGGGGTFDGMEPRIAALEAHVEYLKRDITDLKTSVEAVRGDVGAVKVNLATLTERVAHLPSKGFVVTALIASLAIIASLITFQNQIQKLVGAS